MNTKFIFVTGGVVSSLGKGITAASLGALLQARGFTVVLRKLDPYLNVDPGTMNPYQHGEVFVTEDGMEADLDLGHYERFTENITTSADYTTTGQIYSSVLTKERKGDYLGATVQVIPHITDEIKKFICNKTDNVDFVICEIGGTVGDIEGLPYFEAIRQMRSDLGRRRTMFIHLTLLPYIQTASELKTKPTQHSIKELLSVGIQADIIVCRSDRVFSHELKSKLAQFCNVQTNDVIAGLDAKTVYHVPLQYHQENLDGRVCDYFDINFEQRLINLDKWQKLTYCLDNPLRKLKIAIAGKYVALPDAYKSLIEAITHAAVAKQSEADIMWLDTEQAINFPDLAKVQGIIVPGGFGHRGVDGKIEVIKFARENKIPTLAICLGMQLMVIEACRNVLGIADASSTEFGATTAPVIGLMSDWASDIKGGTMRLGSYPCHLTPNTLAYKIYQKSVILERHRHRYEINPAYRKELEGAGLSFSGMSPDNALTEIVEWQHHPWFIGVQFHPELESNPFNPHPLFNAFLMSILANF